MATQNSVGAGARQAGALMPTPSRGGGEPRQGLRLNTVVGPRLPALLPGDRGVASDVPAMADDAGSTSAPRVRPGSASMLRASGGRCGQRTAAGLGQQSLGAGALRQADRG